MCVWGRVCQHCEGAVVGGEAANTAVQGRDEEFLVWGRGASEGGQIGETLAGAEWCCLHHTLGVRARKGQP